MKRALLFFILYVKAYSLILAQDSPPQNIRVTFLVTGEWQSRHGGPSTINWKASYEGKNFDGFNGIGCYSLTRDAVYANTWYTWPVTDNPLWRKEYLKVDNVDKAFNLGVAGFLKRCTSGFHNGDGCNYITNCYCTTFTKCNENADKDYDDGVLAYNRWFYDGVPGTWNNSKDVFTKNGWYGLRFSYFFTPPIPNYPKLIGNYGTNNICGGETFQLQTDCPKNTGDYVWQESTNGGMWSDIPGQNTKILTIKAPSDVRSGTFITKEYRVYKRDNGVLSLDFAKIRNPIYIFPPKPHIENSYITIINPKCNGESSGKIKINKVDGSGSYKYSLKSLNGNPIILNSTINYPTFPDDAANNILSGLPQGQYQIKVENVDGGGCLDSINISITDPPKLILNSLVDLTYNGGVNISCSGLKNGSITLNASGGTKPYSYYISETATFSSNRMSSLNKFGGLAGGYYYLRVKDSNGCISNTIKDTLVEPSIFKSSVLAFDAKCNGSNDGVISFVNSSGGTLPYSYSVNNHENYQTSASVNFLAPSSYICHAKDANGCGIKDTTVSISEPEEFVITPSDIKEATCFDRNDGGFSVSASGGTPAYKFSLDGEDFLSKKDFTFIQGGNHLVRIKDKNECIDTLTVYVGRPDSISIDFDITEVQCSGFSNGVIKTNLSGGIKPFSYQWQDFPNKDTLIENIAPGNYNLSIIDANNCKSSKVAVITEPSNQLEVSFTTKIDPKCNIECNGQLEILPLGGTPPYYYQWNNDTTLTTPTLNNLCQGIYKARILDSRNCIATIEGSLQDSVQFVFSFPDSTIICPGKQVTFDAGNIGSDYEWRDEHSLLTKSQIFTTHTDGTYHLKVKNTDGCYAEKTFKLKTSKELLNAQFLLPSFVEYGDTVVFVEVSKPLPDSIQWSFDGNPVLLDSPKDSPELYFGKPGSYSVKLTAFLGECTDSIRKTITFFIPPVSVGGNDSLGLGLNKIKAVKIYPNPNNGMFFTQIDLDKEQAIDIEILNSQGLPISKGSYNGQENYLLNFSLPLGTGVYLMKILTPTDIRTIAFIVQ